MPKLFSDFCNRFSFGYFVWSKLALICCFATFFYPKKAFHQELPPIQNFTPVEYGAENQNWAIAQTNGSFVYAANNSGLLEYTGAQWKRYPSPNGTALRSLVAANGLLYSGCYMEFGFWKRNALGEQIYTSLKGKLKQPLLEDEEFWKIINIDNWVLFQSLKRIYIFDTVKGTIDAVEAESTKAQMFKFNGTVYFQKHAEGLFKIDQGKTVLVTNDEIVKKNLVVGLFSHQEKPLILTEKGDFYFLDNGALHVWKTPLNSALQPINVYSSLQLRNGNLVLGSISGGIFIVDPNNMTVVGVNQAKGLNNNTVLDVFEDTEQNVWAALDNGISILNLNSPFKEYIDKNGKLGVVYASAAFNGHLYLGTNQGMFYKRLYFDEEFRFIKNTEGQVWYLKEIDGILFCGHNKGTLIVNQHDANLVANVPGTWSIKKIPGRDGLLLQGNYNGLGVLEKVGEIYRFRNKLSGFDISSRFFEFTGPNDLVINHEFKGIYSLTIDEDFTKVVAIAQNAPKGVGASLVNYGDQVFYTSSEGIFALDPDKKTFGIDSTLTSLLYGGDDDPIGIFVSEGKSSRVWCFGSRNIFGLSKNKFNNAPQVSKYAMPVWLRKNLGVTGFENITHLGAETFLIGTSNGYLTLDLTKSPEKKYAVLLSEILVSGKDYPTSKVDGSRLGSFDSGRNNFQFSFAMPEFAKYIESNYQYRLEGMYNEWGAWSTVSEVTYENLPFGTYTFRVRGKAGNTMGLNEAVYHFEIKRPWYLTNFAFIIYAMTFAFTAFTIHRLYKGYYLKQRQLLVKENKKKLRQKELKAQKKIVQLKNEMLQEEIESKNRELAISTMSIIKKNEFLNAIKAQLNKTNDKGHIESVIKTIDKNIATEDDWKFFEDAFNNADKDFLKKIKGLHPELTSNDMRLCAYLRLNLSSKEIAPLLNISIRSVEVKRYRLRKKMDLHHEINLIDYVLSL